MLLVLSLGTPEKSLTPFSLLSGIYYGWIRCPWDFSVPGCTVPSSQPERCFSPLIIFVALSWSRPSMFLFLFVLGSTALQMLLTGAEQKGRITSLDLMAMLCLMRPQGISPKECLAFFAAKEYSWLMVSLVPPGAPGPSLHICFPAGWPPACAGTWGFIPPQVQALHSLLLNLIRFASPDFFSL